MRATWSFPPSRWTDARGLLALAICVVAVVALACASGDDGAPPTPDATEAIEDLIATAGPAEEVLSAWVRDRLGQGFVPRCEDAQRPDDIGSQCARLHSERDGRLAYQLGPVFSEPTRLFILELQDGEWTIIHDETHSGELTSIPWPLAVGADVIVVAEGDCLQVRNEPGLSGVPVDCIDDGTPATIGAGPAERNNLTWWRLEGLGWVAGTFLRYPADDA